MSEQTTQETGEQVNEQTLETTAEVENTGNELEETQQAEPEAKAQKVVPLAALHEERNRVKELRERQRVMEDRFNQLQQAVTQRLAPQQQEQQPVIPDVNVDPVGHFRTANEQLTRQLEAQGRTTQEIQQTLQAQQQYQQVQMHVGSQISEYAKEKPDVRDAITHAQQADARALVAVGYEPAQAQQMVARQFDQMIFGLIQQGRNVAESMYALAEAKGYTPKTGGAPATAQEKLQSTQKIAGAARSLGSGGGVASKLSLSALAEMPAADFAKSIGDDDAWRKLWGG